MVDDVALYPEIGVGASFGNGWRQLWPNFLMLFLIGLITGVIQSILPALIAVAGIFSFHGGNLTVAVATRLN